MRGARMSGRDLQRSKKTAAAQIEARLAKQLARIGELEMALLGVIDHWREFGSMMIENKTDFGFDERIELIAKMVGR